MINPEFLSFWFTQSIAIALTAFILPKLKVTNIFGLIGTAVALALINTTIWDSALFFNVPDSISVKALVLLGSNGALFLILVKLLPGIEIEGITSALLAPVVITLSNFILEKYAGDIDWVQVLEMVKNIKEYLLGSKGSSG